MDTVNGFVLSRHSFLKKDKFEIFTRTKGRLICFLSVSKSYFRRIEMFDYCILDITNHVGEYWLVTGCFEIQTNFFARQNFKNFLFWNFISELLINCLEEQTAYEEIFDALNKFWKFPNTSNLLNVITSVSLSSGVTKCDESIENQIDQIELAFDFELKSKREFFEILRTEIIA